MRPSLLARASDKDCWYFHSHRGCKHGDGCHFKHAINSKSVLGSVTIMIMNKLEKMEENTEKRMKEMKQSIDIRLEKIERAQNRPKKEEDEQKGTNHPIPPSLNINVRENGYYNEMFKLVIKLKEEMIQLKKEMMNSLKVTRNSLQETQKSTKEEVIQLKEAQKALKREVMTICTYNKEIQNSFKETQKSLELTKETKELLKEIAAKEFLKMEDKIILIITDMRRHLGTTNEHNLTNLSAEINNHENERKKELEKSTDKLYNKMILMEKENEETYNAMDRNIESFKRFNIALIANGDSTKAFAVNKSYRNLEKKYEESLKILPTKDIDELGRNLSGIIDEEKFEAMSNELRRNLSAKQKISLKSLPESLKSLKAKDIDEVRRNLSGIIDEAKIGKYDIDCEEEENEDSYVEDAETSNQQSNCSHESYEDDTDYESDKDGTDYETDNMESSNEDGSNEDVETDETDRNENSYIEDK